MEVRTVVNHLRGGSSNRSIARSLQIDRRTVQRLRVWAQEQGLLAGELPEMAELHSQVSAFYGKDAPPQNQSALEAYREIVVKLHGAGHETAAIWQRLKERGFGGSYSAVWRFVQKIDPTLPQLTVRVECAAGEEGQVDFGYAGLMHDPASGGLRKSWAFVMTLSWSRHQYVEFVFDQKVTTWLACHRNALAWLGGVPQRLVIDNLKAAIVRACWDDPEVQQAYAECAEHYGFLIAPCRPATPQHKGKVESGGVHYVKRNFLAGRTPTSLAQANQDVLVWCESTAGLRRHGTTKEQPLLRFQSTEQALLQPLPAAPYDLAVWKVVKVHRDCYVVFDNAYYSVPYRLVGQQVRVRGGVESVRIFGMDYQLAASHSRATQAGQRLTHPSHLPPHLVDGLYLDRNSCRSLAQEVGPATAQVVAHLLDEGVVDRTPTARRLLKLRQRFDPSRLEAACQRALRFDDPTYATVKGILQRGQEAASPEATPIHAYASIFVRTAAEVVSHLGGGQLWN